MANRTLYLLGVTPGQLDYVTSLVERYNEHPRAVDRFTVTTEQPGGRFYAVIYGTRGRDKAKTLECACDAEMHVSRFIDSLRGTIEFADGAATTKPKAARVVQQPAPPPKSPGVPKLVWFGLALAVLWVWL